MNQEQVNQGGSYGNNSPNAVTVKSKPNPTTRTMASDARRADVIESDRLTASEEAIKEIMALEGVIKSAINNPVEPERPKPQVSVPKAKQAASTSDNPDNTNIASETPEPQLVEVIDDQLPVKIDTEPEPEEAFDKVQKANELELPEEIIKAESLTDELGITYISDELAPAKPAPAKAAIKDPRISALHEEITRIEKNKLEFIEKRSVFTAQEAPLKKQIEAKRINQQAAEAALVPFLSQQEALESKISAIEAEERSASTPEDKHRSEQKRWELEDRRHDIESKKWSAQRELEAIIKDIENLESQVRDIQESARATDQSLADADQRIKELDIEIKLVKLGDTKEELEAKWVELNNQKRQNESELDETRNQEAVIESQIDNLKPLSETQMSPDQQIEYEQKRQEITLERRELEKKRWELELALKKAETSIEDLKPAYQKALEDEKAMFAELEELKS